TMLRLPEYPFGLPASVRIKAAENVYRTYWDDDTAAAIFGGMTPDTREQQHLRRLLRNSTSPRVAQQFAYWQTETDVRHVLPAVRVPTLVVHRSGSTYRRVAHARYLSEHIPGARFVELPGAEQYPWSGDQDAMLGEIQEFLTGVRDVPEADRVLSTILFTDVVASTQRAAETGDRRWHDLFDKHKTVVRQALDRHRGREVHTAGDGFLATFDGPARAVRCALSVVEAVHAVGLEVRAGVHTGEIELADDDITGIAVHIGSRVQDLAGPGEVLASRTVVDLVAGSGLHFEDRGEHELKGVPGRFRPYAATA